MTVADTLGVSISAVLNNELRRFAREQKVSFEVPEVSNAQTARVIKMAEEQIKKEDYHRFSDNKEALDFLKKQLL